MRATIERAAQAWAEAYLWAMEQGTGRHRHGYTGPIADDILTAAGISFDADPRAYGAIEREVRRRGYELAGGKRDGRAFRVTEVNADLIERAKALRAGGAKLQHIAAELGVSDTTVYRMLRAA